MSDQTDQVIAQHLRDSLRSVSARRAEFSDVIRDHGFFRLDHCRVIGLSSRDSSQGLVFLSWYCWDKESSFLGWRRRLVRVPAPNVLDIDACLWHRIVALRGKQWHVGPEISNIVWVEIMDLRAVTHPSGG